MSYCISGQRNSGRLAFRGQANPFARSWQVVRPSDAFFATGDGYLLTSPTALPTWWQVEIWPLGDRFDRLDSLREDAGRKSTILRARISYVSDKAKRQAFDVDIGAGISFSVAPTNRVYIDLLAPEANDPAPRPPGFVVQEFFSSVAASAFCIPASRGRSSITLTQPYYVDVANPVFIAPRTERGQWIQAYESEASGTPLELEYANAGVPVNLGDIPFTGGATRRVLWPGPANQLRGTVGLGATARVVTVVQELNV